MSLHNGPKRRRAPRASQACNGCAAAKARCDNDERCQRCQRRNISCIRPHAVLNDTTTGVKTADQPQSTQSLSDQGSPVLDLPGDFSMEGLVFGSTGQEAPIPAILELLQPTPGEATGVIIFLSPSAALHVSYEKKLIVHLQNRLLKAQQMFCRWVQKECILGKTLWTLHFLLPTSRSRRLSMICSPCRRIHQMIVLKISFTTNQVARM